MFPRNFGMFLEVIGHSHAPASVLINFRCQSHPSKWLCRRGVNSGALLCLCVCTVHVQCHRVPRLKWEHESACDHEFYFDFLHFFHFSFSPLNYDTACAQQRGNNTVLFHTKITFMFFCPFPLYLSLARPVSRFVMICHILLVWILSISILAFNICHSFCCVSRVPLFCSILRRTCAPHVRVIRDPTPRQTEADA